MPPGVDIQTILQALLQQLSGGFGSPEQQSGTHEQQMAGAYGGLGGAQGEPYGLYGSFYGGRIPQPDQSRMPEHPQLPQMGGLGAGFGAR